MKAIFVRYGVWAAVIGAILAILVEVVGIVDAALVFSSALFAILRAISMLLLAVGVWRLHMIQSREGGKLSLVGAIFMIVGYLFAAVFVLTLIGAELPDLEDPGAAIGELAADNPFILIALPFTALGPLVFGIATIRAKVYPRWTGIVLVISPFFLFVVLAGAPAIFGNVGEMLVPLTLGIMAWLMRNYHKTRKRKYTWHY